MGDDGRVVAEPLAPSFQETPAHPVAAYSERVLEPLDPRFDAFAKTLRSARDVRLDLAAADLARVHARGGGTTRALAEFLSQSYGVIEPIADVAITHAATDEDRIADLARAFGPELNFSNTRIGFGEANGAVVAILFYSVRLRLERFPRAYVGSVDVSGEVEPGIDRLAITRWMAGHLPELDRAFMNLGAFRSRVPCTHLGMSWLSFDALDKDGLAHLLQLPVMCGQAARASYIVEPAASFDTTDRERRVAAIISRERGAKNLPPLEVLPVVQASAHAYATLKARDVHVTAPPRLGGFSHWKVFHVDSYEEAVEHILNDPGERAALESRDFNRLGVGVVQATDGGVWIALVYAVVPHPIDTAKAATWVGSEMRKRRGMRPQIDEEASDLASRFATQVALGWRPEDFNSFLKSWANIKDISAYMSIQNVKSLDDVDLQELVKGRRFSKLGVGVAQSAASGTLTGSIWVVVIYLGYWGEIPVMDQQPTPVPH